MLFSSCSNILANTSCADDNLCIQTRSLVKGIAPAASKFPHFSRARRAPERSLFLFCLAGYVNDNLFTCTQTQEVMLAFIFLANFCQSSVSSDFQWLDYQFRNGFNNCLSFMASINIIRS